MKPISMFVRHCNFSVVSSEKERPAYFSRELCHANLKRTTPEDLVDVTYIMDGNLDEHFLAKETDVNIITIQAGSETRSFQAMLDIIFAQNLPDDTLLYLTEDDYLHRDGWALALLEGFEWGRADYLTLYDHGDKYTSAYYETFRPELFVTPSCHWRTTPSTTNTFATTAGVLRRDEHVHRKFAHLDKAYTQDHDRFMDLWKQGAALVSSLPGWATHMTRDDFVSPCVDWAAIAAVEQNA